MSGLDDPPGVKVVKDDTRNINLPDDPSFPFKLKVVMWPPEPEDVVSNILLLGGHVEIIILGKNKRVLDLVILGGLLYNHP